jgi:ABC-type branched-subunit amino acid transport system substrate-binding protein
MKLHLWNGVLLALLPSVLSCTVFDERLHEQVKGEARECETNRECTEQATEASNVTGGGGAVVPSICLKEQGKCARLLNEDCDQVTGDYLDDDAVFIGSMFSTKGALGASPVVAAQRRQSAMLAVDQINAAGGIPGAATGKTRPLVMVSCDDSLELVRSAEHLADVGVAAIVGPTSSASALTVTQEVTAARKIAVLTPTAGAAALADLDDGGFTFQMVPHDTQRGVILLDQINTLEDALRKERSVETIKLGIVFRDDALGQGTRAALDALTVNGRALADPVNLGKNVRIDGYAPATPGWEALVAAHLKLLPDIIVLAGLSETVPNLITPLEAAWPAGTPRPYYVGIDAMQAPPLLDAAAKSDDLRHRIRGTGVTQSPESVAVNNSFRLAYSAHYPDTTAFAPGMGPAFDAVYAIGFALAATRSKPASGESVVAGLRQLSGGTRRIDVEQTQLLGGFSELGRGAAIDAVGTIGRLKWSDAGAMLGGALDVWCVGMPGGTPAFQSSGLTYDLGAAAYAGKFEQCAP